MRQNEILAKLTTFDRIILEGASQVEAAHLALRAALADRLQPMNIARQVGSGYRYAAMSCIIMLMTNPSAHW